MADLTRTEIQTSEDKIQTAEEIAAELEAEQKETPASDRPEWLPEKFESAEDMAKSYAELEAKLSSGEAGSEEKSSGDLTITKEEATEAAEAAGVDLQALTQKYSENGSLSEDDYADLAKRGLSKDDVDNYIAGQEALVERFTQKIYSDFGGEESYTEMTNWAASNLSEAQIALFNEAISSGDAEKASFAVNGLRAQFEKANGSEPGRTLDGNPSTSSGPRYESEAEHIRDMEDPRYWSDPAFREKVERKFDNTWA